MAMSLSRILILLLIILPIGSCVFILFLSLIAVTLTKKFRKEEKIPNSDSAADYTHDITSQPYDISLRPHENAESTEPNNTPLPSPDELTEKSFAEILRDHRTSRHISQEYVAEQLNVSRQAVSKWENGTSEPSTANLIALAKLYGISLDELVRGTNF